MIQADDRGMKYGIHSDRYQGHFYESESYISFLRNTFSFVNDTDTFGAMFGGVAEEYYGTTGLKDEKILRHFLDKRLLELLLEAL